MPPWTLVTLLSLSWSQVLAGGGSGLLLGLAKDGKLGDGGANDWDILIICMAGQSRLSTMSESNFSQQSLDPVEEDLTAVIGVFSDTIF